MVAVMADRIGLALSGGGSRAIAFHLGCLRALKKSGILDRVEVISTDAEGRMVLADGITFARQQGCERILSMATLTR